MRLAVMKCSESLELRQAFADVVFAGLVKGVNEGLKHDLKDLKYPLVDQLEGLNDAPIELIMTSLYLESDSEEDAPSWKKKKCKVVCRTHGIGSAHHARSDGIPVFVHVIAPQGLTVLLADTAIQTEVADEEDEPHLRLQRSISLPPFYHLEWK
ncbi:hypothetical protein Tco_1348099 [Tanacetum coccineum]